MVNECGIVNPVLNVQTMNEEMNERLMWIWGHWYIQWFQCHLEGIFSCVLSADWGGQTPRTWFCISDHAWAGSGHRLKHICVSSQELSLLGCLGHRDSPCRASVLFLKDPVRTFESWAFQGRGLWMQKRQNILKKSILEDRASTWL